AVSAWMSLVLITGITAFMLNPGNWQQNFWRAFFNPQFLPQTLARTGAALLLTTLYVYLHASLRARPQALHDLIAQRSTLPAMIGGGLIILGGLGWLLALPPSARLALAGAAALNVLMVLIFFCTAVVLAMFYLGPYRHPAWLSPGAAILLFLIGLAVTGAGEFVREAVRKPFVIYGEVYSHNVYRGELPSLQREGFLNGGVWTRRYIARTVPALMTSTGQIDATRIPALPLDQQLEVGHTLFNYHCASCHAPSGYSGMKELLPGWTGEMIGSLIVNLDRFHYLMPPWSGTPEEAGALRRYLETLAPPTPMTNKNGSP
ncbi:MAG TPA: cytochrome c, partial [bacterium]